VNESEVLDLVARCSNAGKWGSDDELGTLNYITAEVRLAALACVRHGEVVSIGKDLKTSGSRQSPPSATHLMLYAGHEPAAALDSITVNTHGFEVTHLDAITHSYFRGGVYNGRAAAEAIDAAGVTFGSILAMRDGIVTRGVLLDVAKTRGVTYLQETDGIGVADLEAAEELANTRVRSGDAIFIHTGHDLREEVEGWKGETRREGVLSEVLPWLHEREVAVYSGDCIERMPSGIPDLPMPLHQVGLAAMGLTLLDIPDLGALKAACVSHGTAEFLLIVSPLRIPRGTGSPVNPLAVF
jgi:kynurenine formamidase